MKQDPGLKFSRKQNKDVSTLTEIYINDDQIHHIRVNWLGPMLFSPGDSHRKRLHVLLLPGREGITETDTNPKNRFMSFKVTHSNDRFFLHFCTSRA